MKTTHTLAISISTCLLLAACNPKGQEATAPSVPTTEVKAQKPTSPSVPTTEVKAQEPSAPKVPTIEWKSIQFSFREQDYKEYLATKPPEPLAAKARLMISVLERAHAQGETLAVAKAKVDVFDPAHEKHNFSLLGDQTIGRLRMPDGTTLFSSHVLSDVPDFPVGAEVFLIMGLSDGIPTGPNAVLSSSP